MPREPLQLLRCIESREEVPMRQVMALALALVGLALTFGSSTGVNAGGGCHSKSSVPFSDTAETTVAAGECVFTPTVVRVAAGQEVRFVNKDPVVHTFTGVAGTWGDIEGYGEGESVTYAFNEPGVFPYFCELHPGMVGAVVVGDGAAAANAGAAPKAVSAVSGGQADASAATASRTSEEGGGSTGEIIAAVAVLGAVLGGVGLAPLALRRIRSRA
jgi:plastocyanin